MTVLATSGPTALWYLSRSTGAVAMVLLTVSVVLGVIDVRRLSAPEWPRFLIDRLHRNVSLLVLALLVVHIVTSVLDGFAPIGLIAGVVPFSTQYRPLWMALGALAFDLLLAVIITSVLRRRFGHRAWRAVHWLAYASWPIALLHTVGTGSDVKSAWLQLLGIACLVAVIAAVWWRAMADWPTYAGRRAAALSATVIGPIALLAWLPGGPLGKGWARRAGTPRSLLVSASASSSATGSRSSARGSTAHRPAPDRRALEGPFTERLAGTIRQGASPVAGLVTVELALRIGGSGHRRVNVRMDGEPSPGGGISLQDSQVTYGTLGQPDIYSGRIASLNGPQITAVLSRSDGRGVTMQLALSLSPDTGSAGGTITVQPASGGGA